MSLYIPLYSTDRKEKKGEKPLASAQLVSMIEGQIFEILKIDEAKATKIGHAQENRTPHRRNRDGNCRLRAVEISLHDVANGLRAPNLSRQLESRPRPEAVSILFAFPQFSEGTKRNATYCPTTCVQKQMAAMQRRTLKLIQIAVQNRRVMQSNKTTNTRLMY